MGWGGGGRGHRGTVSYFIMFFRSPLFYHSVPVNSLHKSIAGRHGPVRVADGPITARYRFM